MMMSHIENANIVSSGQEGEQYNTENVLEFAKSSSSSGSGNGKARRFNSTVVETSGKRARKSISMAQQ
jgi:hypothetical protein